MQDLKIAIQNYLKVRNKLTGDFRKNQNNYIIGLMRAFRIVRGF